MTLTLYGIKTCDTCRKALKALPDAEFRDIRTAPLSAQELHEFLAAFGEALLNRNSTTWRGLDEDTRALSPDALLEAHPTLMKRPVLRAKGKLYLGWTPRTRDALGIA